LGAPGIGARPYEATTPVLYYGRSKRPRPLGPCTARPDRSPRQAGPQWTGLAVGSP